MKLSGMNSVGGKIILWGLILGMLAFTTTRTIHFLSLTFPPDQRYVAYIGLVAFDIGVLGWFYYATHSAEGVAQRTVAYGMIFICIGGVICTTVADMVLVGSQNGLTTLPDQWGTVGLWAVIIVIVLNFVAGIVVHLVDPKHLQHMAKESAKDKIHSLVISEIHARAQEIAPTVAQQAAQYWVNQTVHEFIGHIPGAKAPAQLPPPQIQQASFAQQGNFAERMDAAQSYAQWTGNDRYVRQLQQAQTNVPYLQTGPLQPWNIPAPQGTSGPLASAPNQQNGTGQK